MENQKKPHPDDAFDKEYIGNIWGWKFSWFGLALLTVLLAMILYRHFVLGLPVFEGADMGGIMQPIDSLG